MASAIKILEGLQILGKYVDLEKEYLSAEHDEIYFPGDKNELTREDSQRLDDLGFIWNDSVASYMCFT